MAIRISAIVCTLNRAQYLRKAVQSLKNQTLPKDGYEIIVVDNGSTDGTAEIAREESKGMPSLQYLREPVLGLSHARNTGWRNAKGEYVAYLDDDAVASRSWLEKILKVFETVQPKPGCVGGKVEAIWEAPRPHWLSEAMVPYLTVVAWSNTPTIVRDGWWLVGANMAFAKSVLQTAGGFNSSLGRIGNRLSSNEEIALQRLLVKKGHCCYYHPEVAVAHHIPASRLSKGWFFRRVFWQGVCDAWAELEEESRSIAERLKIGLRVGRKILFSRRQMSYLAIPTNDPRRFELKCYALARIGYVLSMWGLVR